MSPNNFQKLTDQSAACIPRDSSSSIDSDSEAVEVHLGPPISERPGCLHTTNFTFKRTHVAQVNACDVSDAAQVLGQCKSATIVQILGFNPGEPFDLLSRNFALKYNMTANEITCWLCPHTLTSTKRTSELATTGEVQLRQ